MICDYRTLVDKFGNIKEENAMIKNVDIFIEDHGILTSFVNIKFNYGHQGFGGYNLRGEYLFRWVSGILEITDKSKLNQLSDIPVRVVIKNGLIKAIGNFLEDKWYYHE